MRWTERSALGVTCPNRGDAAYKNIAFGDRDPPSRLQMQTSAQVV